MKKYAYGAYGTGNLGDDAILEGMRKEYGNSLIAVCSHPESIPSPSITVDNLLETVVKGDLVIFGGGGLLYSIQATKEMGNIAKECLEKGAKVECQGMGIEGEAWKNDKESIRYFTQFMRNITVRSKKSVEMLSELKIKSKLRKDFAFNIPSPLPREHRGKKIGLIVTAPFTNQPEMDKLTNLIQQLTEVGEVHLIPHVRHFTGMECNDCLAIEYLFVQAHRPIKVIVEPWAGTPSKLLEQYNQMDFIVTMRFHGMILGMICNRVSKDKIGITCLTADTKYTAFAQENSISLHNFKDETLNWIPELVKEVSQYLDKRMTSYS